MELWIRSQDKRKFVQCKSICIGGYVAHKDEKSLWCEQYNVGIYKTEQRALEVLSEIQRYIRPNIVLDEYGSIKNCYEYSKVYEMPKD